MHTVKDGWGSHSEGFAADPWRDHWWEEGGDGSDLRQSRDGDREYSPGGGGGFRGERKRGYPYKETVWNEGRDFDAPGLDRPAGSSAAGDFDYDPREQPPFQDKWWRRDDYTLWDFAP